MLEWLITTLAMTGIEGATKASDKRKSKVELAQHKQSIATYVSPTPPSTPPVRYQNKGKQMMYERYLQDLKENPEWAAFKVRHNQYGGYVFDDTEK